MIGGAVYPVKRQPQEKPWHWVFSVQPQGRSLWEGKFNCLSQAVNFKPGLFLDCAKNYSAGSFCLLASSRL